VPGSLSWFLSFSPSLHLPLSFFYLFSRPTSCRSGGSRRFPLLVLWSLHPQGRDDVCEKASYMFLRKVLPVPLANTVREVNLLQEDLLNHPLVGLVQSCPEDPRVLDNFLQVLIKVRNKHNDVAPTMAQGVIEYKKFGFDPFISNVCETAKTLCEQCYLVPPELEVEEFSAKAPNKPIQVVYVPSHLFPMLFELFKNSMRATVKPYEDRKEGTNLTYRWWVPLRKIDRLFHYMYSTTLRPSLELTRAAPLVGFGYGLPISRLYARYFQGDLKLYSIEGVVTDAVVYFNALSSEALERLLAFNKSTWRPYKSTDEADDWRNPSREPRDASEYKAKQDKMKADRTL
ncbi:hypothetical protein FD755_018689, partial [Muntiacus reevesi]